MRALIRSLLIADIPDNIDIPADRWKGGGSLRKRPATPFAEIRFGGRFRGVGSVQRRRLEVWIHDEEGDFGRIEDTLKYVKSVLDGAEHRTDGSGAELISCSWVNDSTDLYDDGYRTNCMMASFDVVGREV